MILLSVTMFPLLIGDKCLPSHLLLRRPLLPLLGNVAFRVILTLLAFRISPALSAMNKRRITSPPAFCSPVTNESYDRRQRSQSTFQRRNDRNFQQSKPTPNQSQSRGNKSFRGGRPSKGRSSTEN